ncbi:MAG TPA: non-ribosomal peptide synthetase, partial [Ktedonobacter sp.]|nr:non-ribosomal peptide synthetase [Ktedonobacter sp.]
ACLTVGDAGAAVILDRSPDTRYGFHEFDMYTVGRYYDLCIAKPSDKQNSGAIMYTDAVRVSAVNIQQAVSHAAHIIERSGWSQEAFQHIVMHQTSKMTIYDAGREINTYFGKELCNEQNLINNIAERGNTATTTHTVALMDHIRNGDIRSDSNVIFGITGSGVNIGTAIYTFDDLPDRLRRSTSGEWRPEKVKPTERITPLLPSTRRVQVESIGTFPLDAPEKRETLEMVRVAAEHCFANSSHEKKDIDLLIYAGIYRDEYISEPAIAAMVAGTLDINADVESQSDKKTFSFDLFNGSTGFLDACYTSIAMMQGHQVKTAMVVASEVENNREVLPTSLRGIEETASIVLLDESKDGQTGFGNFVFKHFTDYLESLNTYTTHVNGRIGLHIEQDPLLERYYRQCIEETVRELLRVEQLDISDIKLIVPPQISSSFIDGLSETLSVGRKRFVDVHAEHDLFTSSTAFGLQQVREKGLAKSGDIGLIIEVGAGIQVACATYHF